MAVFSTLLSFAVLAIQVAGLTQQSSHSYQSPAGLSAQEVQFLIPTIDIIPTPPPPPPINDTSVRLVHDAAHPYIPPGPDDIRGPCPGLNTLANHGYLPHNGIATPAQIMNAAQEGFNMPYGVATIIVYSAMIVDGNPLTNLMSIGRKSPLTGYDPPKPAIVGGLNTHAVFEGDASLTRQDFFIGNNHDFNNDLFEEMAFFSNLYGEGSFNVTAAGELRYRRIQQSIQNNPEFTLLSPRFTTVYGEAAFALLFFVDGRINNRVLSIHDARDFFQHGRFPRDFHSTDGSTVLDSLGELIEDIFAAHPFEPGRNNGTVNSYIVDSSQPGLLDLCGVYTNFVINIIEPLYPRPEGLLKDNLNANLNYFFQPFSSLNCTQLFPYGK